MIDRVVKGSIAGTVATGTMSIVIWGLRRAGVYKSTPPPRKAARGAIARALPWPHPKPPKQPTTALLHTGFGAGAGAAYNLASPVVRPSVRTGVLYGIAIWFVSYKGWLPALDIMPPPEKDEQGRAVTMFVAHIVYGATLGSLCKRLR